MSNLTVHGITTDTNYSCAACNKAGTSEKDMCVVTVLNKGKKDIFLWENFVLY